VVKKSLEPVVLSLLDKPISGYDIVHEIHNRYRVLIPQARVYTLLENPNCIVLRKREKNTSAGNSITSSRCSGISWVVEGATRWKFRIKNHK